MPAFNKFNSFTADLATKVHNLGSDTLKVLLTNTAPAAANTVYANISATQVANGAGYTTGGAAVTSQALSNANGMEKLVATGPTFTATGSMGPFQYAVLYNDTPTSPLKPLIGYWNNGSSVTLANTETFTVGFDPTLGVLTIA